MAIILTTRNAGPMASVMLSVVVHLTTGFAGAQTIAPDKGFVLEPIPTTSDLPGTVFRVDPLGNRYDVADLSGRLPPHVADVAVPDFTMTRSVNAGFFARFLTTVKLVDAEAAKAGTVSFRMRGVKKESSRDAEIDSALLRAFPIGSLRRPGTYFIIRETISATTVDYELSNELLAALTAGVQFRKAVSGNANLKITSSDGRKLQQTFKTPHRIFYKIERLIPRPAVASAARLTRASVASEVLWNSERAEPGSALASGPEGLSKIQFLALQQELRDQGCGVTNVDGRYGPETRRAIASCARKFNTANNAVALLGAMNVAFGPNDNSPPR